MLLLLVLMLLLPAAAAAAPHPTYTFRAGQMDIKGPLLLRRGNHTLAEAEAVCVALGDCAGFTFGHSGGPTVRTFRGRRIVFFVQSIGMNNRVGWTSYLKDYRPPQVTSTVFTFNESAGIPCVREPSITMVGDGVLLAFAGCRAYIGDGCYPCTHTPCEGGVMQPRPLFHPSPHHINRSEHTCMKRSTDFGITWSALAFPFGRVRTSIPAVVYDEVTRRVILQGCGPTDLPPAGSPRWPQRTMQSISSDDGVSWSSPVDFSDLGCSKGRGLQLRHGPKAGRILFIGGLGASDRVSYSDDHGVSYQLSLTVLSQMNEAQLVELPSPPGAVMANMRVSANATFPPDVRAIATSTNSGVTWSRPEPAPDLIAPANGCMGSTISVDSTQSEAPPMIYFSGPNSTFDRTHMTIKRSADGGKSYPRDAQTLVYSGLSGYSCLTHVKQSGKIGLLWETEAEGCVGAACRLVFSMLETRWKSDDRPSSEAVVAPAPTPVLCRAGKSPDGTIPGTCTPGAPFNLRLPSPFNGGQLYMQCAIHVMRCRVAFRHAVC